MQARRRWSRVRSARARRCRRQTASSCRYRRRAFAPLCRRRCRFEPVPIFQPGSPTAKRPGRQKRCRSGGPPAPGDRSSVQRRLSSSTHLAICPARVRGRAAPDRAVSGDPRGPDRAPHEHRCRGCGPKDAGASRGSGGSHGPTASRRRSGARWPLRPLLLERRSHLPRARRSSPPFKPIHEPMGIAGTRNAKDFPAAAESLPRGDRIGPRREASATPRVAGPLTALVLDHCVHHAFDDETIAFGEAPHLQRQHRSVFFETVIAV